MKITVVTDKYGTVIGTIQGPAASAQHGGPEAAPVFEPGHRLHHLDVDDALAKITDANELHEQVAKHLPKS